MTPRICILNEASELLSMETKSSGNIVPFNPKKVQFGEKDKIKFFGIIFNEGGLLCGWSEESSMLCLVLR